MTLIYFIIVLMVTIMIHELGHFIFAKLSNVYVYEFSIGMGPKIFSKKKKETLYSLRLLPIGGYVSMAGEDEADFKIPSDRQLCNKSFWPRFLTLVAGVSFNIILALIILFVIGLLYGNVKNDTVINYIDKDYPIAKTNIKENDKIIKIDDASISSYEDIALELIVKNGKDLTFTVQHQNGEIEKVKVKPIKKDDNWTYGFSLENTREKGFINAIKYSFGQTKKLFKQMFRTLQYLITGKLKLNSLSGPIGIYQIVGTASQAGIINIIYLIAYLCINVAIINILPFPAFDGGRVLFLFIEVLTHKKVDSKIENMIHTIGFILLMILMIYISYNDILKLFK